jgi:hypothetical protein
VSARTLALWTCGSARPAPLTVHLKIINVAFFLLAQSLAASPSPSSTLYLHHIRAQAAAFLPLHRAHRKLHRCGRQPPRVARRPGEGSSLAGPRPGVGAAGCCQVVSPSSTAGWPKLAVPRSTLRCPEEGRTTHVFKITFQVFQKFHRYVASVSYGYYKSRSGCYICCNGCTCML